MTDLKIVGKKKQSLRDQALEVLEFLNAKTGRHYRDVDLNINFIKVRLESGMEVSDLKAIVAMKVREWKDDEVMKKFLRPATLFNREKCEQYFGELE